MDLEKEIRSIRKRNARVEKDKAWETSLTRRLCICVLTYLVVVIYSFAIQYTSNIWLSSIVPVLGFTLSTLSLSSIRKAWEKHQK
jgi:preprotein translocase subunit SecF